MILGTGVDIVSVPRLQRAMERHGDRFLQKIFTEGEIAYASGKARENEHLAGRFAAKEAVLKALGTGAGKDTHFREIEVVRDALGKPAIALHGDTATAFAALGGQRIHISISHTEEFAVAQAIIEGKA